MRPMSEVGKTDDPGTAGKGSELTLRERLANSSFCQFHPLLQCLIAQLASIWGGIEGQEERNAEAIAVVDVHFIMFFK